MKVYGLKDFNEDGRFTRLEARLLEEASKAKQVLYISPSTSSRIYTLLAPIPNNGYNHRSTMEAIDKKQANIMHATCMQAMNE